MVTPDFIILKFLYPHGLGRYVNISPILSELSGNVDKFDIQNVLDAKDNISRLLNELKGQDLIDFQQYSLGSGNLTTGFTWIDTVPIIAAIRQAGKDIVDKEIAKADTEKLLKSQISANESVETTNQAVVESIRFQKKAQVWSIIFAGLSTGFILITVIQSIFDNTGQSLQKIEEQLQKQSKAIQSLDTSLKKIDSSIEKKNLDSVYLIQK